MATKRASRESCRSVSIDVAHRATALRNAARVFSGACPEAPRCPITSIPICSAFAIVAGNTALPQRFLSSKELFGKCSDPSTMLASNSRFFPYTYLVFILNLTCMGPKKFVGEEFMRKEMRALFAALMLTAASGPAHYTDSGLTHANKRQRREVYTRYGIPTTVSTPLSTYL